MQQGCKSTYSSSNEDIMIPLKTLYQAAQLVTPKQGEHTPSKAHEGPTNTAPAGQLHHARAAARASAAVDATTEQHLSQHMEKSLSTAPAGQLNHARAAARAGEPAGAQLAVLAHERGARKPLRIALREAHAHLHTRSYCLQAGLQGQVAPLILYFNPRSAWTSQVAPLLFKLPPARYRADFR